MTATFRGKSISALVAEGNLTEVVVLPQTSFDDWVFLCKMTNKIWFICWDNVEAEMQRIKIDAGVDFTISCVCVCVCSNVLNIL